jgi:hypothetical protein
LKSLMLFVHYVLIDIGTWCHTSTHFDRKTIEARVEHEGISFLTISLPRFGADFQKSLDRGFVANDLFTGFQWKGGLPRLFSGFLSLVFDTSTGRLLDDPSIDAIRAIRQITLMFAKISLECTSARKWKAIERYVECEQELRMSDLSRSEKDNSDFKRISQLLFRDVFTTIDSSVYYGNIIPKHGTGSTADHILGNEKYDVAYWTDRLETYFPAMENILPSYGFISESSIPRYLEPGAEIPVKVITVPKTLKTPRIIAMEPVVMQYVQQGLHEQFASAFRKDDISRWLIDYSSQVPNQHLARRGSLFGDLATLDLSEASDRVSNQLVRLMLSNFPHLAAGVDACRSRKADVPGVGVLRLAKFASMGSALCFPFEAMVFATVIFLGIERVLNRPLTREIISSFAGSVRVYGDDIIVPVEFVSSVCSMLRTFGFKVNADKSFWTGKFRESCGKEYYDGNDVSIVKLRSLFPSSRKHATELVSTVALRNLLFQAGFDSTIEFLDNMIEDIIPFPAVEETSSVLGKLTHIGYTTERVSTDLQIPLVKGAVVKVTLPVSRPSGVGALLKYFLKRSELPFVDEEHLLRAGRAVSVDIVTRWACPF